MMLLKLRELAAAVVMSVCFLLCSNAAVGASTSVSIAGSANVEGIAESGSVVSDGGLDGAGNAYAAALLGTTTTWDGVVFSLGKANTLDAISSSTLDLPAGSYSTLYLLATGVFGDQLNQTFVVTYTDGTSSTFKQSLSDWRTPQNYPGESKAMVQAYRLNASGANENGPFYVYGYSFAISKGKTAKSVTLPDNRDVVVLALSLGAPLETTVSVAGATNVDGIASAGAAAESGGLDGRGYAYSAALLGTATTWAGVSFSLGAAGALDATSGSTLSLPAGYYTALNILATGVNGGAANQSFIVNYTDGTSSTFLQSISDWYTPHNYAGESIALTQAYRVSPSGATQNGPFYIYGYSFAISSTKIVKSVQLPRNRDVIVLGVTLSASGLQPVSSAPPVAPAVVPATPTGLSASAGNAQVSLSWSASSGAAGYHVKRATTSGGPYSQVGAPTATSYTDSSLTNGTTYYYVVSAVYSSAESANSTQVSATPAAPVVVVGKCDGLGAPGVFQEITPPGVTLSPPYDGVLVTLPDPNNPGTVYATTFQNGIYKSTDCGASWVKTNTGKNGTMLDQGRIWSAVIDPVNSQTIYALTGYGPNGVWKSTNGGVDWTNIGPNLPGVPGFVARIGLDPTNHLHLLLIFHENCTGNYNPLCIAQTQDGGATWSILNFPTSLADQWGEGWFLDPLDATHWVMQASVLYYTADGGTTWSGIVSPNGVGNIQGPPYRAPDNSLWLASTQGVITSTTNGATWSLVQNSGGGVDGVTGCGNNLYSIVGFQPPPNNNYVYTATFANPTAWSLLPTPGLAQPMDSGANSVTCDTTHGIVYIAAQAAGLWRMATGVTN